MTKRTYMLWGGDRHGDYVELYEGTTVFRSPRRFRVADIPPPSQEETPQSAPISDTVEEYRLIEGTEIFGLWNPEINHWAEAEVCEWIENARESRRRMNGGTTINAESVSDPEKVARIARYYIEQRIGQFPGMWTDEVQEFLSAPSGTPLSDIAKPELQPVAPASDSYDYQKIARDRLEHIRLSADTTDPAVRQDVLLMELFTGTAKPIEPMDLQDDAEWQRRIEDLSRSGYVTKERHYHTMSIALVLTGSGKLALKTMLRNWHEDRLEQEREREKRIKTLEDEKRKPRRKLDLS